MLVIGLTGGIGTGKSQVSEILKELGAHFINADLLGHEAYEPRTPTWRRIVDVFGHGILTSGGEVDRKKLGEIVFADPNCLVQLNAIMHPRIYQMIEERLKRLTPELHKVVVIEAALLIEANWQTLVDEIWVTTSPEEQVVERLRTKRNLEESAIRARIQSQMPQTERIGHATVVINNSGSTQQLEQIIRELWDNRVHTV